MKNEAIERPFPQNLFHDLGIEQTEQADDFLGTLMYVLRTVSSARDSRMVLLRYKEGKTFDEIGVQLDLTKQRVNALMIKILDEMKPYSQMLSKGLKQYYIDLFDDRIAEMTEVLEASEREQIRKKAYEEGYRVGFGDGEFGTVSNEVSNDVLKGIKINSLQLSPRTFNALSKNGIDNLGDVVSLGDDIIDLRSFGKSCFCEIAEHLKSNGVRVVRTFPLSCKKFDWSDTDE